MALVHCRECGEMIAESAPTCPKCGAKQKTGTSLNVNTEDFKAGSTGLKVLSFLIPIAGLILFLVKGKEEPVAAKSYGLWAIAGFVLALLLALLF